MVHCVRASDGYNCPLFDNRMELDRAVHACNPSTRGAEVEDPKFEASQVYTARLSPPNIPPPTHMCTHTKWRKRRNQSENFVSELLTRDRRTWV